MLIYFWSSTVTHVLSVVILNIWFGEKQFVVVVFLILVAQHDVKKMPFTFLQPCLWLDPVVFLWLQFWGFILSRPNCTDVTEASFINTGLHEAGCLLEHHSDEKTKKNLFLPSLKLVWVSHTDLILPLIYYLFIYFLAWRFSFTMFMRHSNF